jgi:diacylglycerol O-acyltransferase / trehalose O-mycolyltransferase
VKFRDNGTHSWAYWQEDLHESWPMVAASLGV